MRPKVATGKSLEKELRYLTIRPQWIVEPTPGHRNAGELTGGNCYLLRTANVTATLAGPEWDLGVHSSPSQKTMESISELINFDIRHSMFRNATRFVDYELVPGDIFEFGVYTGRSLALLAHYHEVNKKSIHQINFARRVVGFDSFQGLPGGDDHPRWKTGMFRVNHSFHPICKQGEPVTERVIQMLFEKYQLPAPSIEAGEFSRTLPKVIGSKYTAAAIVHIDCDLYESTHAVLCGIQPVLQEGTILLFDDWFNFRGSRHKGEQKAFFEFMSGQRDWSYTAYQPYATFGNSFILTRP